MNSSQILSLITLLVTGLGGWLVNSGTMDHSTWETISGGIIAFVSWWIAHCFHSSPPPSSGSNKYPLFLFALLLALAPSARAQGLIGAPITVNGQTFLVATNSAGNITVSTFGTNGTALTEVPATPDQAMAAVSAMMGANNPANSVYYGSNEIVGSIFAGYIQNGGQAVAGLSVEKYGLFGWQNIGLGGGVLQGNKGGKSGTAGAFIEGTYRKPIGDVAFECGPVFGYDNWNSQFFGGGKAGLEYRHSAHVGTFIDVSYNFEAKQNATEGEMIWAGVRYAF